MGIFSGTNNTDVKFRNRDRVTVTGPLEITTAQQQNNFLPWDPLRRKS